MVEERHLPILPYAILISVVLFSQGSQGISERSYVYINALCGFKFQSVDNSWQSFRENYTFHFKEGRRKDWGGEHKKILFQGLQRTLSSMRLIIQ